MPTLRTTPATFSDDSIDFACPSKWSSLTQEQLRYLLFLVNHFSVDTVKTYAVCRFCGIVPQSRDTKRGWLCQVKTDRGTIRTWIQPDEFAVMTQQLDFVTKPQTFDVRLESIDGCSPVHQLLRGVAFRDYLTLENYYQAFLRTQDYRYLDKMTSILYLKDGEIKRDIKVSDEERTGTLYWYIYIKSEFNRYFPHFFIPAGGASESDPMQVMNAQIRLLTGGDITKEEQVLGMDCWRALTELDAKAHIAQEQKKHQKH